MIYRIRNGSGGCAKDGSVIIFRLHIGSDGYVKGIAHVWRLRYRNNDGRVIIYVYLLILEVVLYRLHIG